MILNINVKLSVSGKKVPFWRVKLFGWCAQILGVPVEITVA
jgi:hypothetical protein